MDIHTIENSVRTLEELRDVYQSQLDTSVLEEIEAVLKALKRERSLTNARLAKDLAGQVLSLISQVIRVVTNITDLMS
jgi:ABC-type dipeptide/oligopeptide/nickel transport system ATPase subunit